MGDNCVRRQRQCLHNAKAAASRKGAPQTQSWSLRGRASWTRPVASHCTAAECRECRAKCINLYHPETAKMEVWGILSPDVQATKSQLSCCSQCVDREMFLLIPFRGVRQKFLLGKVPSNFLKIMLRGNETG